MAGATAGGFRIAVSSLAVAPSVRAVRPSRVVAEAWQEPQERRAPDARLPLAAASRNLTLRASARAATWRTSGRWTSREVRAPRGRAAARRALHLSSADAPPPPHASPRRHRGGADARGGAQRAARVRQPLRGAGGRDARRAPLSASRHAASARLRSACSPCAAAAHLAPLNPCALTPPAAGCVTAPPDACALVRRTPAPTSALDMLHAEQRRRHIITFCAELDGLLGGGVAPGEITECVRRGHCLVAAPDADVAPRSQDLCVVRASCVLRPPRVLTRASAARRRRPRAR